MRKKVKVIMLPTEKSRIYQEQGKLYFNPTTMHIPVKPQPQHLYFISNDIIEEGEWYCNINIGKIIKCDNKSVGTVNLFDQTKKIIATTNESLGLPKPSDKFIKKYCKEGGMDTVKIKYLTKTDCDCFATTHEGCSECLSYVLKVNPDNTINIKI